MVNMRFPPAFGTAVAKDLSPRRRPLIPIGRAAEGKEEGRCFGNAESCSGSHPEVIALQSKRANQSQPLPNLSVEIAGTEEVRTVLVEYNEVLRTKGDTDPEPYVARCHPEHQEEARGLLNAARFLKRAWK